MTRAAKPLRIASQLGPRLDAAVTSRTPDLALEIIPIARGHADGVRTSGAEVLFAFPFHQAGEPSRSRPAGWPYGLRWVQLISSGIDLYPPWLFEGPSVTSARGSTAGPIAEFCLALIFAAAKDLPKSWIEGPDQWRPRSLGSIEGASLGIFGLGAIGEALAGRALALGMRVHAVRRSRTPMMNGVIRVEDIAALASLCDHLVLTAPATPDTRHILSRAALHQAKPGLHVINVGRGLLIDDDALLEALDDGRVGLASLDVTEPEPLPSGHPYYSHPRVRVSPHTSVMTPDIDDRVAEVIVDNLRRYLDGVPLINVIRAEA